MTDASGEHAPAESAAPATDTRFAAVIVNPTKVDVDEVRRAVVGAGEQRGWGEPLWIETTAEDPGQGMAAQAHARGAALVLAAGGDGTVRAVAEGMRGTGIPVAILPSGTGNLLARNLDLPLADVESSVRIAFDGVDRAIDVCVAEISRPAGSPEERAFVVMAGLGIDAEIMASTNAKLKKTVGWLAYIDAGLRALPKAKPFPISYRLEGRHEHTAHVSTVLIGNCGRLQGGIDLIPDASIDDGKLDVAVLQPKGLFGWLQVWRKVRWENGALKRSAIGRTILKNTSRRGTDTVTYLRSSGVRLKLEEPRLMELDGDDIGETTGVRIYTDAGALVVGGAPTV